MSDVTVRVSSATQPYPLPYRAENPTSDHNTLNLNIQPPNVHSNPFVCLLETAEHTVAPAMITRCMKMRLLEST